MIERKRAGLSAEQKVDLWSRRKAGQSLHEIGRALGRDHVMIQFLLARVAPVWTVSHNLKVILSVVSVAYSQFLCTVCRSLTKIVSKKRCL